MSPREYLLAGLLILFTFVSILLAAIVLIQKRKTRKSKLQLKESLDKVRFFRAFADFTHDWEFWRTDDGRFLYISPSCRDITGYNSEDFYADPELFFRILHPEDREAFRKILEHPDQEERGITFRIMTADGRIRWMEHISKRVKDSDGNSNGYLGANRDITERKRYEKDLTEALRNAKEADKAKSRFLANMSHEIRTPLNAIIGFSDLLSLGIGETKYKNYLDAISSAGRSLQNLISDILDLSRIESGRMQISYVAVDLNNLVHEIDRLFRIKVMEKGLMLRTTVAGASNLRLRLDENRLRQILINLVNNAVKYTDSGEIQLTVQVTEDRMPAKYNLLFTIKDTGQGIDEENLTKIFNPFEQVHQDDPDIEGTGLGLAITKSLADLLGAELSVSSTLGKGSTFSIRFSGVDRENDLPEHEADLPFEAVRFDGQSVLVVDDVPSNLILLKEFLLRLNLKPLTAANGKEALALAEKEKPSCVIMDIRMPVMDGEEAARRLKSRSDTRDIPLFALTASAKTTETEKRFQGLFEDILMKPVRLSHVVTALSRVLDFTIYTKKKDSEIKTMKVEPFQPQLLAELDESIMPRLQENKDFIIHDDLISLADSIKKLAEKYDSSLLDHYSRELKESVRSFNMSYISDLLERFPAIRDMIEHGGQGDRESTDTDN